MGKFSKMFGGFGKGIVTNHRTGKVAGKNNKVHMETKTSRKGLGDLGNFLFDVADAINDSNKTTSQRDFEKSTVVSAYIEEVGSDYVLVATFADGTSDTREYGFISRANSALAEIKRSCGLIELQGTSFLFDASKVLVNREFITDVQVNNKTIKIIFENDSSMSVKYDWNSKLDSDLDKLGYRRTRRTGFEFNIRFGNDNAASRLGNILNG